MSGALSSPRVRFNSISQAETALTKTTPDSSIALRAFFDKRGLSAGHHASLFHFRDAIAAHWPTTKPALIRLCAAAGCQLHALREINGLSIEASDLQADPAHKGLLVLAATIKNRMPYPLAYPHLELTLSDIQKQTQQDVVVVRRAFAPQEYASGTADLDSGIPANGELSVKLFIDASATTQAGYQVYLFYP